MSTATCPVPLEQRPINEYQELKDSWFFRWAALEQWAYFKPILILWGLSWIVVGPVTAASFSPEKHLAQFTFLASTVACWLPGLAIVRLYLGWTYVKNRLADPTVFYEESGWYDGQVWEKPPEVQMQDQLVVTYQLEPILGRLQKTLAVLGIATAIGILGWWIV
jgi:Conserved in the green lineage and diatoms 27